MIVERNLKNFIEENTIVYTNVPDLDGITEAEDGKPRTWTIRPLTAAQEEREQKARLSNSAYQQRVIAQSMRRWEAVQQGEDPDKVDLPSEEELGIEVSAEQYAPIVAAIVAEPQLDVDYLAENFHGLLLRRIADEVLSFFQTVGERAGVKENRQQRRGR